MRIISIIITFVFFTSGCLATFDDLGVGARPQGLAGAFVATAGDADAILFNPAGLSSLQRGYTLFYSQPYGLSGLSSGWIAAVQRIGHGSLGLGFKGLGNDLYRENSFILSYGQRIKYLSLGANMRLLNLSIEGYGSAYTLGLDLGLHSTLAPKLQWGAFLRNINSPHIGHAKEEIPQTFTAGLCLQPSPNFALEFDLYQDIRYEPQLRMGLEYSPYRSVQTRVGWRSPPGRFSLGGGVTWQGMRFDYALLNHWQLGLSHYFSFTYTLEVRSIPQPEKPPPAPRIAAYSLPPLPTIVNLNLARRKELESLPGIGATLARRIVGYRHREGGFVSGNDLLEISGIGGDLLSRLKGKVWPPVEDEANR